MIRIPATTLSCLLACVLTCVPQVPAQGQPPTPQEGLIRQVTLYRDQALVSREIVIPPGARLRSIDVPHLPELLDVDSVFADGDRRTVVRAVRVSPHPGTESNREEVRELDDRAETLNRERATTRQALDVVIKDLEGLDRMVNFSVVAGQADLNRGVLNAATLTELTTFAMHQRRTLSTEQFRHETRLGDLEKQLQQLKHHRDQVIQGQPRAHYQARIFVETTDEQGGTIRLNYLVGGCGWSPQYTIRGAVGEPGFELRYSALVQQMSGEDWRDIQLVLSTASPSISAARPILSPLRVVTRNQTDAAEPANPGGDPFAGDPFAETPRHTPTGNVERMIQALRDQQRAAESAMGLGQLTASTENRDIALNALAGKMQEIELQVESESWRTVAPDANDDVASQVYTLAQTVSLDTRREQQLVQILETKLTGEMYHVASPLLSTFAYREVQATNTQPIGLIGGPATVYLDGRFVGRMQIPSTASGQRLTVGFGADQQVRTRRELLEKQDKVQGGNRQLTFSYRLVLANFKSEPISVRLMDRMPITQQTQQLSLRMEEPRLPLSEDGLYQRILRPTGVLRWDLTLPADRHGSQAFDVLYSYSMEFDRSQTPSTQHLLADLQTEYDNLGLPAGMGGFGGGLGTGVFGSGGGGGFGGGGSFGGGGQ